MNGPLQDKILFYIESYINYGGTMYNIIVNGNWSEWSEWSSCSSSCNGGVTQRSRSCDNPEPQFNGSSCTGNHIGQMPCNITNCPGIFLREGK